LASCDDVARPWLLQEQQHHHGFAYTHGVLGRVYALQGNDEMNITYHNICNVYRKYNNTAVYVNPGKNVEALELYDKCLAIDIKALGEDHPSVATTYNNIASVYRNQGKYEEALVLYDKCLATRIKALGEDHPDVAGTYNDIAIVYKNQRKYEMALELHEKSLAISIKAKGEDHLSVARTKYSIASLLAWRQVELVRAGVYLRESAAIYNGVLGANDKKTIVALMSAGICERGAALVRAGGRVGTWASLQWASAYAPA